MTEWHTYENGLCFFRFQSGKLCNNRATHELRSYDGNGHGIFCERHIQEATERIRTVVDSEMYWEPFRRTNLI
jgi:hypothetical protein